MKYLKIIIAFVSSFLLYGTAFGQTNINREVTNSYDASVDRMQDSLRIVSDSLYGIGMNYFQKGNLNNALTFFRKADITDSIAWRTDYNNDLFCSAKAWMIYILCSQNRKKEASEIAGHCFSYLGLNDSLTAEYLYRIKPFDRRPFDQKMDSLHKELDKKKIPYSLDWGHQEGSYEGFLEEEKLVRKMFGPNHYLNAEYLQGLGNICRNPNTALYYYRKAKRIFDDYSTQNYMDSVNYWKGNGLGSSIAKVESEIYADSLFDEGIKLYKFEKYNDAASLFEQCSDIYKKECRYYCSPGQRATGGINGDRSMIYVLRKGDFPTMWQASCYKKMGDIDKAKKNFIFL